MGKRRKIEEKNNLIQEKIATQEINREKISKLPLFKDQFDKIEADESKIKIGLTNDRVVNLLEKIEEIKKSFESVEKKSPQIVKSNVNFHSSLVTFILIFCARTFRL